MKVTLLALGGLLAIGSFCACNNNDDDMNQMPNAADSAFVNQAGMSNTAEINAAQLALTKSMDTAIQHFAQKMIDDHTAAQASLKNIAAQYSLTVPDSVDAAHAQLQMATLSPGAFDTLYIHQQVTDHQAAIQIFQNETNGGNNADLKNFADTTLPKLQMHLDLANNLVASY